MSFEWDYTVWRRDGPSRPAFASSAGGPAREHAPACVADRPSRARRGGEHAYARRATRIAHTRAPGACAACVSVPSNAPAVIRRGLGGGCTVAGFARGTLRTQRGEHCRFARPIRLRVACEICGVTAAHKDSDTSYGHGLLLRLASDCCDRCVAHGGPDARTRPHQRRWTRWRVARLPVTRLYPGSGRLSATAPEISNPAVAAAREQTSPAADAATGRPSALPGPSARRAPEHRCATRSCAPSCDDGAFAFVRRQSLTEQAADQPRGCEHQTPAPTRAPTCRAMLQRASRRKCACWGTSRLTVCSNW